jgi:hypothetical protein
MIETAADHRVAAPIEAAWATITDVGAYPGIVRSDDGVEFRTIQTRGVGATWRQTRTVWGWEHARVLQVVAGIPRTGS